MIRLCPFCGFKLRCPLQEGITTCDNCKRIIISSSINKILSAAWNVRNWHVEDLDVLKKQCELTDEELSLVKEHVVDHQLIHDDLLKVILRDNPTLN